MNDICTACTLFYVT